MASAQKISELTTAGPLTGAELVPIVQNSGTLQTTVSVVAAFAIVSLAPVVSALGTQIANVSAQASANSAAITSTNAVIGALEVRVSAASATGVANTAAITSINAVTSTLDVRVSVLEAALSAIGDVSTIAGLVSTVAILDADVSALEIRMAAVSAATSVNAAAISVNSIDIASNTSAISVNAAAISVNAAAITSVNNVVSALEVRVSAVSAAAVTNAAAITSINNVVSALEIRVSAVSATGVTNATAITSINNAVSALEVRVSAVSATGTTNAAAITSINNVVSAVQVQVNAVSVSVGQRVLKAGDTMTGALTISTSADAQALTVAGFGTFTSRVSISAGFYTGLQNYQDNTLQRATFRDYALVLVAKGTVSATTSLDLTEGNFFSVVAAGSTTFVFVNPPVSALPTGGAAGGFVLELTNGGAATVTWPATVDWPGGTAPTLTASGIDMIVCITDDGGTNWRCVQSMKDSK